MKRCNNRSVVSVFIVCSLEGMCREGRVRCPFRGCACQLQPKPNSSLLLPRASEVASEVLCVCVWRERRFDSIWNATHGAYTASRKMSTPVYDFGVCLCLGSTPCRKETAVAAARRGVLHPGRRRPTMGRDDDQEHERLFTLSEANHL